MYDDLVERLRYCADSDNQCSECKYRFGSSDGSKMCLDLLMVDAADAIEELSRMEQDFRQYISDQVNREKGVYACCYCKHRESTNKYEPGCTLEKCDGVSGWAWGVPKEEA